MTPSMNNPPEPGGPRVSTLSYLEPVRSGRGRREIISMWRASSVCSTGPQTWCQRPGQGGGRQQVPGALPGACSLRPEFSSGVVVVVVVTVPPPTNADLSLARAGLRAPTPERKKKKKKKVGGEMNSQTEFVSTVQIRSSSTSPIET